MAYNYEYPYVDPDRHNDDWALHTIKKLEDEIPGIKETLAQHGIDIEALQKWVSNFENQDPSIIASIIQRFINNAIFVGINDSGYFYINIPDGWSDITFATTGLDYPLMGYDYGHLVLLA